MLNKINSHNYTNLQRFSNSSLNDEIKIEKEKKFLEVNENENKQTPGTHCKPFFRENPETHYKPSSEEFRARTAYTEKLERV